MVTFDLLGETFALPILDVREVIRPVTITPVPQAPHFVEGVINLRGHIIPVASLRKRFGLAPQATDINTRIIVVELGNGLTMGLVVDAVHEIARIPLEGIAPPPPLVAGSIGAECIKGISTHEGAMVVHIDMQRVFTPAEMHALENLN